MRAWLNDYVSLLLTAFVIGVAIAIIGPILSSLIKEKFPTRTASAIGIYSLGMGAGATLSAGLTGILYVKIGEEWEYALAFWSSLALLAYLVWVVAMKPEKEIAVPIERRKCDSIIPFAVDKYESMAYFIVFWFSSFIVFLIDDMACICCKRTRI